MGTGLNGNFTGAGNTNAGSDTAGFSGTPNLPTMTDLDAMAEHAYANGSFVLPGQPDPNAFSVPASAQQLYRAPAQPAYPQIMPAQQAPGRSLPPDPAPTAQATECYGKSSEIYLNRLMEFINDEYKDYLFYTAMAVKAPTQTARRIFRNMAKTELSHSKKFAAAYFLISGKRYMPTRAQVGPVQVPAYDQALRQRFMAETRDAAKYAAFANSTTDRCLKKLAAEASADERQHAQHILELIQTMD